ncbi:MAG: hypothetical protein HPY54_09115 [Chthonomonadetes bacterium]|nr:hypothetical protein [Chthonomonadetes bacterium]
MWRSGLCLVAMTVGVLAIGSAQPLSLKTMHVDTKPHTAIAASTLFNTLIPDKTRRPTLPVRDEVDEFATVVPVLFPESFEPFCFEPLGCAHFTPEPEDSRGLTGNPYEFPSVKSQGVNTGKSYTTVYADFINDSPNPAEVYPPTPFRELWRKKTIVNTVNLRRLRVEDSRAWNQLLQSVQKLAQEDDSPGVLPVKAPPYSEGCVKWSVFFTGYATTVKVIPFKRKQSHRTLEAFLEAFASFLSPRKDFLSVLIAESAREWIKAHNEQQESDLEPLDIKAYGDICSVQTESYYADFVRLRNLTQEWRIYIRVKYPDGSTAPAEGTIDALRDTPLTDPAPPPPLGPSPDLRVGKDGATVHLGKGWRWKLQVRLPGGEERLVEVPHPEPTITLYIHAAAPPSQPSGGK